MFEPGENTTTLYFADRHQTIVYVAHVLRKSKVSVSDLDELQKYLESRQFDDKMTVWLDFRGVNSINNRVMKKLIDNPKTKRLRFDAITGLLPSMDLKFRCLANIVIDDEDTTTKKE